jgi:multidrug transporter EmrE-like cation transporter
MKMKEENDSAGSDDCLTDIRQTNGETNDEKSYPITK